MWHITPLDKIQQCTAQSAEACSQEPPEHHFPTKIAASLYLDELRSESVIDPISGFHIRELRRVRPRSGAPDRFLRSLKDDLDEKFEGSEPGEIKGVNMVTTARSRVLPVSYGIFRNVRSDGSGTWKLVCADRADKHVRHRFSTKDSGEGDPRVTGEIDEAVDAFRDLIYKEYGSATWEFRPESTQEFDRAIAADMAAILSCVYYVEEYLSPLNSGSDRLYIGSASYLFNHLIQSDGSLAGQVPYFSGFDARDISRLFRCSPAVRDRYARIDITVAEEPDAYLRREIGDRAPAWALRNAQGRWQYNEIENGESVTHALASPDDAFAKVMEHFERLENVQGFATSGDKVQRGQYRRAATRRAEWARDFMRNTDAFALAHDAARAQAAKNAQG